MVEKCHQCLESGVHLAVLHLESAIFVKNVKILVLFHCANGGCDPIISAISK